MNTQYVVETHQLCKQYGKQYAVNHMDMHIKKGDIYGFIGRNGAGKSTTLKMIAGLIHSSFGEIKLFGGPSDNQKMCIRDSVCTGDNEPRFFMFNRMKHNIIIHIFYKGH